MWGNAAWMYSRRSRRNRSNSSKEPKNLENQENATAETNEQDEEGDQLIRCPYCDRTFRKMAHLKLHFVIHSPSRENNNRLNKKRHGSSNKERPRKAKAETESSSEDDASTASKKRRDRKRASKRYKAKKVAPPKRAPFSDVSNGETPRSVPGSAATEEPPLGASSDVYDAVPLDLSKPQIPARAAKSREVEDDVVEVIELQSDSDGSFEDVAIVEPTAVPAAIEYQPRPAVRFEDVEIVGPSYEPTAVPAAIEYQPRPAVPFEDVGIFRPSYESTAMSAAIEYLQSQPVVQSYRQKQFNPDYNAVAAHLESLKWPSKCYFCEVKLDLSCSVRLVGPLPPYIFPLVDIDELFYEGTMVFLNGIELCERLTTGEEDYLRILKLIIRSMEFIRVVGEVESTISDDSNDSYLDHCEDLVPDDFYTVLASIKTCN